MADLQTFVSLFLARIGAPLWATWTNGSILTLPLVFWLLRQIVKSIRKLY